LFALLRYTLLTTGIYNNNSVSVLIRQPVQHVGEIGSLTHSLTATCINKFGKPVICKYSSPLPTTGFNLYAHRKIGGFRTKRCTFAGCSAQWLPKPVLYCRVSYVTVPCIICWVRCEGFDRVLDQRPQCPVSTRPGSCFLQRKPRGWPKAQFCVSASLQPGLQHSSVWAHHFNPAYTPIHSHSKQEPPRALFTATRQTQKQFPVPANWVLRVEMTIRVVSKLKKYGVSPELQINMTYFLMIKKNFWKIPNF
jgi:hypothetical protein